MTAAKLPTYRISPEVISADLTEEAVLLHMQTKDYFQLNVTGQFVWKRLEEGSSGPEVVDALVTAFDVSPEDAAAAYLQLTDQLAASGLVIPAE